MMVIDGLDLRVCTGELPNDFEVQTIIGKCFDDSNVGWLVKWMACGLCKATCVPLNNTHCPYVVCVKHNGMVNNRHHIQNTKAK